MLVSELGKPAERRDDLREVVHLAAAGGRGLSCISSGPS